MVLHTYSSEESEPSEVMPILTKTHMPVHALIKILQMCERHRADPVAMSSHQCISWYVGNTLLQQELDIAFGSHCDVHTMSKLADASRDADKVSERTDKTLQSVAQLELIQAPGLPFSVPKDFLSYPRLTGRYQHWVRCWKCCHWWQALFGCKDITNTGMQLQKVKSFLVLLNFAWGYACLCDSLTPFHPCFLYQLMIALQVLVLTGTAAVRNNTSNKISAWRLF